MRYIELFAGIGGFRYGLEGVVSPIREEANWQPNSRKQGSSNSFGNTIQKRGQSDIACVYSNEWDKHAASIYRRHYGSIDTRDIATVDVRDIPEHDLLTGGFPCQAFSVAGKRLGFDDTRGTLFFEIARILDHHRPGHILLENVKGLLSHDSGKTFQSILGVLSDLGYRTEWMVLNSKHFGVPQNRERVFIVGHLRGQCSGKVFPVRQSSAITYKGDAKIAATLQHPGHSGGNYKGMNMIEITSNQNQGQRIYDSTGVAKTLAGEAEGQGAKTGLYFVGGLGEPKRLEDGKSLGRNYNQGKRVYDSRGIANTLPSQSVGGQGGHTGLYAMRGRDPENPSNRETGAPTEQRLEKNETGTTNTITSVQKDNLWHTGSRIRRLTPVECERLQGFPDGWTAKGIDENGNEVDISDTQRYKCLGNAVTTNVISAIGEKLLDHIKGVTAE